jgi:putative MFS transporter
MIDDPAGAGSEADVVARLERLPVSWWHVRARLVLGTATFFDAFDILAVSFALPVLAVAWKLTPPEIGAVLSAAFVGQLIGAFIAGAAAERYGRLFVATITVAVFGVMSIACAFAWNQPSLMVFRFIQGIGLGGEVPIATAYISEFARARTRGRFYILYEMVFVVGLVAAALLGYLLVPTLGWQVMFYIGAIPAALAVVLRRLLPESPRWLAQQGRRREADAAVAQIENSILARGGTLPPPEPIPLPPPDRGNRWTAMFRDAYLRRTLGVWAMWFCCFSTTYGLLSWMPTLYRTMFHLPLSQALAFGLITQAAGFVGAFLCAMLIDRAGRRPWFVGAFLLGGAMLLAIAWIGPQSATVLLAFICAGAFFMSTVAIGLNLYTAELYPTRFRAFASSVGGAWQRVAAAVGPLVVGALVSGGLTGVFLYFGGIAIVGAVVAALFAVETKGRPLEIVSQ